MILPREIKFSKVTAWIKLAVMLFDELSCESSQITEIRKKGKIMNLRNRRGVCSNCGPLEC
jgi:hypothetical protein